MQPGLEFTALVLFLLVFLLIWGEAASLSTIT
jgi:hypothetical protein